MDYGSLTFLCRCVYFMQVFFSFIKAFDSWKEEVPKLHMSKDNLVIARS